MRAARFAPTVAAVILCTAALSWVQYSYDGLSGSDSYFHARAAQQIAEHGFDRTFEQAAFSTWSERYSDKDLLFHLYLIPFQWVGGGDLIASAKSAMSGLYAVYFAVFAWCLHRLRARAPWLWVLLACFAGAGVVSPLLNVRPGMLGACFVLLEVVWVAERRGKPLAVTVALHALAHSSFALIPGLWFAGVLAALLRGERIWGRGALWCGAGLAAGLLFNPYVPNNIFIAWDQIVQVALGAWTGATTIPQSLFGAELLPARTHRVLFLFPAYLPALAGAVVFAARQRRLSSTGLTLLLSTGVLLAPALLSERFFRFFFPVVALAGARVWSEWAAGDDWATLRRRGRSFRLAAALILGCLLYGLATRPMSTLQQRGAALAATENRKPAIEFLARNAAPDDVVYHNFWWDFSALYHFRPEGRYVVGLDPVFLLRHDVGRFRKAVALYDGSSADPYSTIAGDFDARWIFISKQQRNRTFFNLIRQEVRFLKAYEDDHAVVVRVGP